MRRGCFLFLAAIGSACGGQTEPPPVDSGLTSDSTPSPDSGGDVGSPDDEGRHDGALPPCEAGGACEIGMCQSGICCNGVVVAGVCRCGTGVSCDALHVCCKDRKRPLTDPDRCLRRVVDCAGP